MGCISSKPEKKNPQQNGESSTRKPEQQPNLSLTKKMSKSSQKKVTRKPNDSPIIYEPLKLRPILQENLKRNDIFNIIKEGDVQKLDNFLFSVKIDGFIIDGHCDQKAESIATIEEQKKWNPLLWAIYYQKESIVHYFITNYNLPLKIYGRDPIIQLNENETYLQDKSVHQIFCLKLAILNKNLPIFKLIWDQYEAWDFAHFQTVLNLIIENEWTEGLEYLSDCFTTDCILDSLSTLKLNQTIYQWIHKVKDDDKQNNLYLLCLLQFKKIAFFILLYSMNALPQFDSLVEEHLFYLNDKDYLYFKEMLSQDELESIDHLKSKSKLLSDKLDEFDKKVDETVIKHEKMAQYQLATYYQSGSQELVHQLKEKDFRRLEYFQDKAMSKLIHHYHISHLQSIESPFITIFHDVLLDDNLTQEQKCEILQNAYTQGINFWNAFRIIPSSIDLLNEDIASFESPLLDLGNALLLAIAKKEPLVLSKLLSFQNLWGYHSLKLALQGALELQHSPSLLHLIQSQVFKYSYHDLEIQQQIQIAEQLYLFKPQSDEYEMAIASSPYSAAYVFVRMDRQRYKDIQTYQFFGIAADSIQTPSDLEVIAMTNPRLVQNFVKFVRIQDTETEQYIQGMKIVKILEFAAKSQQLISKYNQESMLLIDDEGDESEVIDEDDIKIMIGGYIASGKRSQDAALNGNNTSNQVQDSVQQLEETLIKIVENQDEEALYSIYKGNPNLDSIFIKVPSDQTVEIYTKDTENSEYVRYDSLNIVQLISSLDFSDTAVGYFLREHQVVGPLYIKKNLPGSVLILNNRDNFEEGASLIFRILISWGRITTLTSLLEGYKGIWTSANIITAAEVLIAREDFEHLERMLDTSVVQDLFENSSQLMRKRFTQLMESLANTEGEYILNQFTNTNYQQRLQESKEGSSIYTAIADNNIEYLKTQLVGIERLGDINFETIDPQIIDFIVRASDSQQINLTQLNSVLLSIYYKSYDCVVEFITVYPHCVREALKGEDTFENVFTLENQYNFNTLGLALLAHAQNINILNFFLKQDGFIPSPLDYQSLVNYFYDKKFYQGLQSIFKSFNLQVVFSSMDQDKFQKPLIKSIIDRGIEIKNIIVRPYLSIVFLLLLEYKGELKGAEILAQECLKGLTRDDFLVLLYKEREMMKTALQSGQTISSNPKVAQTIQYILQRIRNELRIDG